MGVRSLTRQLASEAADAARRNAFAAEWSAALPPIISGNGGTKEAPNERDGRSATRVRADLPELSAEVPARDTRWKPPGGVADRFRINSTGSVADHITSDLKRDAALSTTQHTVDDGGNGTALSGVPADADAAAITIELKSS